MSPAWQLPLRVRHAVWLQGPPHAVHTHGHHVSGSEPLSHLSLGRHVAMLTLFGESVMLAVQANIVSVDGLDLLRHAQQKDVFANSWIVE